MSFVVKPAHMSGFAPITATTAPGTTFTTRAELAAHYKSPWHRYNLKRKEASLPCLDQATFAARVAAAQMMKEEKEEREKRVGAGHLKGDAGMKREKQEKTSKKKAANVPAVTIAEPGDAAAPEEEEEEVVDEFEVEINPLQDVFSLNPAAIRASLALNVETMAGDYGFFLPRQESCIDTEGFVGYLSEKVKLGHMCLFCNRVFTTASGTIKHMKDVGHTKVSWDGDYDEEYDAFFLYEEFAGEEGDSTIDEEGEEGSEDDGEWEDVSDSEEIDYDTYEDSLHASGFSVTPLGELRLPSGKTLGHRGLKRYYDQHFSVDTGGLNAAAHDAAMDNVAQKAGYDGWGGESGAEAQVSIVDKVSGLRGLGRVGVTGMGSGNEKMPTGVMGGGVLVKTASGGFTQLSLYRYKAMAKKARIQEAGGWRRWLKFNYANNNKMDKKGNRLHSANKHSRGVRVGGFGGC